MRRHIVSALVLTALVASSPSLARAASDSDQRLRYEFQDKTLILRGFYTGSALHFDPDGTLREQTATGDWTVDGVVRVEEVSVSGSRLRIKASRLHWGWVTPSGFSPVHDYDKNGHLDRDEKKRRILQIEADLGSDSTSSGAEAAFSRIFLSSKDSFADLVPEYWKVCVKSAVGGGTDLKYQSCRFSPEFLQVPGVALSSEAQTNSSAPKPESGESASERPRVLPIGHGVSPPKVLSQKDPEFSEAARRAKYQGTVVIGLIVNSTGSPADIHIMKPIGCGLDEKAVHTIENWKFKPAEKDGQPVVVEIAVEVDFHLY